MNAGAALIRQASSRWQGKRRVDDCAAPTNAGSTPGHPLQKVPGTLTGGSQSTRHGTVK